MHTKLRKRSLLLIEFQEEWLNEKGKLYHLMKDKNQFLDSIKNAKKAVHSARENGFNIIHSGLCFSKTYSELGTADFGLRAAIKSHKTFQRDQPGCQFTPPFSPQEEEFVVGGRTGGSAFAGSNLDSYLRNNQIETLYIMGYALHVCVESTLRIAHDLGYKVILIEDACSAFTAEQQHHVLNEVVHHFCKKITTQEFIEKSVKE